MLVVTGGRRDHWLCVAQKNSDSRLAAIENDGLRGNSADRGAFDTDPHSPGSMVVFSLRPISVVMGWMA